MTSPEASRRSLPAVSVAVLLMLAATGAAAQDPEPTTADGWKISIGLGALTKPDYEGSDDYSIDPLPEISINYRDLLFLRGTTLGANAVTMKGPNPNDKLQIGPLIRYRPGRDQDDNAALRGLGDVGPSAELGGFMRYSIDRWSLDLTAVQDVADGHDGALVEVGGGYAMQFTPSLRGNLRASTTWASDKYMESFFGITAAQSARSGRPQYDASAGMKDVGLSLGLDYDLTENWGLGGSLGYSRLLGDAADSPIVEQDGTPNQFRAGLLLRYRF